MYNVSNMAMMTRFIIEKDEPPLKISRVIQIGVFGFNANPRYTLSKAEELIKELYPEYKIAFKCVVQDEVGKAVVISNVACRPRYLNSLIKPT